MLHSCVCCMFKTIRMIPWGWGECEDAQTTGIYGGLRICTRYCRRMFDISGVRCTVTSVDAWCEHAQNTGIYCIWVASHNIVSQRYGDDGMMTMMMITIVQLSYTSFRQVLQPCFVLKIVLKPHFATLLRLQSDTPPYAPAPLL